MSAEFVVLGAGAAGLTAAYELNRAGHDVVVIDRSAECGGTHRSTNIGGYTFDAGSIFFEQAHPFFAMFPGVKELCTTTFRRQARIAPDGQIRHYPFEPKEVLSWSRLRQMQAVLDLARDRTIIRSPQDAEAFCRSRIGKTAYETSGLKHYIARFHQEDPAQIDVLFCQRRMRFVAQEVRPRALARVALRLVARTREKPKPPRPLFVRPRDGFDKFYGAVRSQLEAKGVRFLMECDIDHIAREQGRFHVSTAAGTVSAHHVVGAIPLDTMHEMLFGTGLGLESIDLVTLFVSVSEITGFEGNVLFNFHPLGRWKRITCYSRIYGVEQGRHYFAVEITQRKHEAKDAAAAFDDFRRHVAQFGIFGHDLTLEGYEIVEDAYPLYRKGCGPTVEQGIERLMDFGITPVGRQGRFAYLPISALVISQTRDQLGAAGPSPLAEETEVGNRVGH
ncbi:FAD-dependent oxidoreductase [Paracoccus sp. MBLB3053]|uniref:FAD-dependent oxidoreductase n=1 Tax=Paracoccus aurantius TaxID=3073814 RepID=A0ABU2HV51_9RHOB|nr:FAD-dependent oxidoreductase [Paracoccus sp. MBLB3053]MDS9468931.1 FAD-dependent oxidoreductase [Paracoccus sp. MBLB3053]